MQSFSEPKEERQIQFFDSLIENGGNVAQAAEAVGYNRCYAYQLAKKYKSYLLDRVEGSIILHAPRAARTLTDMLTDDGSIPNGKARMDAAKEVLDRSGVVKTEKQEVKVDAPNAVLILPAKDSTNGTKDS